MLFSDLLSICLAVFEPGVGLPVLEVDLPEPPDHQFQLPLVEGLEEVLRDEVVESLLQRQKLLLNPMHKPEASVQHVCLVSAYHLYVYILLIFKIVSGIDIYKKYLLTF